MKASMGEIPGDRSRQPVFLIFATESRLPSFYFTERDICGGLGEREDSVTTFRFLTALILLFVSATTLFAGGNREREREDPAAPTPMESEATAISVADAVAVVNGEPITRAEFDSIVESNIYRYEYQSGQEFTPDQRPILERQVLDGMIMRAVLRQEAANLGIEVEDAEIEETFSRFREQFPSDAAYQIALEEEGFTEEEFRAELHRQMLIERLIRSEVYDRITVPEEEIRSFYEENPSYFEQSEQVSARHIILLLDGDEEETAVEERRSELESIRSEIVAGTDFADAAAEYSEGPSATRGGDLGSFGRGEMVPEFEEVAFGLEVGEVSEVFRTSFGLHIVEVTARTEAQTVAYEAVRDSIESYLLEDARNRGARDYVTGLRNAAEIEELIEIEQSAPTAP